MTKDMVRLGITLLLVCGIAGLGLAVVYDQTKPVIEKRAIEDALAAAKAAIPGADQIVEQSKDGVTYWLGQTASGETVGAAMKVSSTGYNGSVPIDMVVGLDTEGKVTKVTITNLAETAGLGSRVKEESYLAKYSGVTDPKQVDVISGATISSKAVQAGVGQAIEFLSQIVAPKVEMVINFASIPDGTYRGSAEGFHGDIQVEVTVSGGKVTAVRILSQDETPDVAGPALSGIPKRIVEQQKADVDAVSGATFTSKGIINAVKDALKDFAVPAGAIPLDITAIADGTYRGAGEGFHGNIEVEVTVSAGQVTAVKILSQDETPDVAGPALSGIPKRIVEQQKVNVDVVSGATFTSKGIMEAVKNALAGAPTK